jgi:SAM-dependent methyltransferase
MGLNWIDVNPLSFNALLLLEREQIGWLPGWLKEDELAIALQANPAVEWYLRHKCPEIDGWVDGVMASAAGAAPADAAPEGVERTRQAELAILRQINDLLVYAIDPTLYDAQPFLAWDSNELRSLTEWGGKTVIDIGSGTGRLALVAAEQAQTVFAVEPVANLRRYIREKAHQQGYANVFPVDGLITELPFPDGFADVTMGGHVFGDHPEAEYAEMRRVTRPGGMIILCPGTGISEQKAHNFLVEQGFEWSVFEEPEDGAKRKYWKTLNHKEP